MSFCSIDGQCVQFGDYEETFSVQSAANPVTYCFARQQAWELENLDIHRFIGNLISLTLFPFPCSSWQSQAIHIYLY